MSTSAPITVFWSWQTDTPAKVNRNFIHDCLERAAKALGRSEALLIEVDRDTKGVGGSPNIADTILAKIRVADVFVWDATLAYSVPRSAPNPNVMLELGYALAVLGDGRLVGVMNTATGAPPDELPFDLQHKRWPLTYSLALPSAGHETGNEGEDDDFTARRAEERKSLVAGLTEALRDALATPKRGAIHSDVNLVAARNLWSLIDSAWMHSWYLARSNVPQYADAQDLKVLNSYVLTSERPECTFDDDILREPHGRLRTAINAYLAAVATQMVIHGSTEHLVISTKAGGWRDDYDERYDTQIKLLGERTDAVWAAWQVYVSALRSLYPEIVSPAT